MNSIVEASVTIALAVVGLAIISVLVSKKANTAGVIQASASGLANNIAVAESPVTGTAVTPILSYPTSQAYGFGS